MILATLTVLWQLAASMSYMTGLLALIVMQRLCLWLAVALFHMTS